MKFNPDELIRYATAGRMRGVSREAIGKLVRRGKLRQVVIDGYPFVFKKEVEQFKPSPAGRPKRVTKKSRPKKSN